eukprot:11754_5
MRWSFTGGEVDWITKTSAPRMFSWMWTPSSPSGCRISSSFPSGTPRRWQTSLATVVLAFPEKILISPMVRT